MIGIQGLASDDQPASDGLGNPDSDDVNARGLVCTSSEQKAALALYPSESGQICNTLETIQDEASTDISDIFQLVPPGIDNPSSSSRSFGSFNCSFSDTVSQPKKRPSKRHQTYSAGPTHIVTVEEAPEIPKCCSATVGYDPTVSRRSTTGAASSSIVEFASPDNHSGDDPSRLQSSSAARLRKSKTSILERPSSADRDSISSSSFSMPQGELTREPSAIRSWIYCSQEDSESSRRELALWLHSIPFFSKMDVFFIERLLPHFEKRRFKSGERILTEGGRTDAMHVIHSGTATVSLNGQIINTIGPKSIFGERAIAATDEAKSNATIAAQSNVVVTVALPTTTLQNILYEESNMFRRFEEEFDKQRTERGERCFGSIRLFQYSGIQFVKVLEMSIEQRQLTKGAYLFHKGQESQEAYLLCRGTVKVIGPHMEIQTFAVDDYADAAIFGEFSLLGITRFRKSSVVVIKESRVQVLTPEALKKAFCAYPSESKVFRDLIEVKEHNEHHTREATDDNDSDSSEDERYMVATESLLIRARPSLDMRQANIESESRIICNFELDMVSELCGCSCRFLEQVADCFVERLYMPGQTLMCERDELTDVLFLQRGTCSTYFHGELFGGIESPSLVCNLMSVVTKTVVTTVVAEVTCFVAAISTRALAECLDDNLEDRSLLFSRAHATFEDQSDEFLNTIAADLETKLASLPLLRDASAEFISLLAGKVRPLIMLPGQIASEEPNEDGELKPKLYILLEGYCHLKDGNTVVGTFRNGAMFGEIDVWALKDCKRYYVETVELCKVCAVDKDDLFSLMWRFPKERLQIEKLVHTRLEDTVYSRVSHHPYFDGLSSDFLSKMCLYLDRRLFYASEDVVHEGAPGESMFIINRGKAELNFKGITIGMVLPGKTFGAAQLLGITKTFHASLRTKRTCHILELTRKSLHAMAHGTTERQWMMAWQQRAKAAFEREMKLFKRKLREQRTMLKVGVGLTGGVHGGDFFLASIISAWRSLVTDRHASEAVAKTDSSFAKSRRTALKHALTPLAPLVTKKVDIEAKDYMQSSAPIRFSRGLQRVELEVNGAGVTSTKAWRHWVQSGRLDVWKGMDAPTWLSAVREEIPNQLMALKAEARGESSSLPGILGSSS